MRAHHRAAKPVPDPPDSELKDGSGGHLDRMAIAFMTRKMTCLHRRDYPAAGKERAHDPEEWSGERAHPDARCKAASV